MYRLSCPARLQRSHNLSHRNPYTIPILPRTQPFSSTSTSLHTPTQIVSLRYLSNYSHSLNILPTFCLYSCTLSQSFHLLLDMHLFTKALSAIKSYIWTSTPVVCTMTPRLAIKTEDDIKATIHHRNQGARKKAQKKGRTTKGNVPGTPTKPVNKLANKIKAQDMATPSTHSRQSPPRPTSPPTKVQKQRPKRDAGRLPRLSLCAEKAQSPCPLLVQMEIDQRNPVEMDIDGVDQSYPVEMEIDEIDEKMYA